MKLLPTSAQPLVQFLTIKQMLNFCVCLLIWENAAVMAAASCCCCNRCEHMCNPHSISLAFKANVLEVVNWFLYTSCAMSKKKKVSRQLSHVKLRWRYAQSGSPSPISIPHEPRLLGMYKHVLGLNNWNLGEREIFLYFYIKRKILSLHQLLFLLWNLSHDAKPLIAFFTSNTIGTYFERIKCIFF